MRKYTRFFTLLSVAAAAMFASCKKESNSGGTLPPMDSTTEKLILSNLFGGTKTMTSVQEYEIAAGQLQVVRALAKTRLVFYPNSFKDQNGNTITSGQIKIRIIEMYTPGQVIANRSTTTADGRLLYSGGQVYVKAYRAGQELLPRVYGIGFPVANTNQAPPMRLFYGNNNNADSTVTWTKANENSGTFVTNTFLDTNVQPNIVYYQFDSCTNFNWINCDEFYNISGIELTDINIVSKDSLGLNHKNTQVFLVFPGLNAVTYMQNFDSALHVWSLSPKYQLPVNTTFHAVSLSLRNGVYYYAEKKNLTVTTNFSDTLKPQKTSLTNVLSALTGL